MKNTPFSMPGVIDIVWIDILGEPYCHISCKAMPLVLQKGSKALIPVLIDCTALALEASSVV